MSLRLFLRNVLTFFVEGFTRTFPSLYLRTFSPKKSKPVVICVIWVFSCDSSRPRSRIHCSTRGLISFSRSSLELPVIMKSSAYLTRLALAFRLALLAFGYFSRSFASNPSKVRLANTGEQIPPCGAPSSVGLRTRFSMKPALSHLLSMVLSIGACATNQLWLILSKHALRSPSNIHSAPALLLSTVWHCSIASAVERSLLNP